MPTNNSLGTAVDFGILGGVQVANDSVGTTDRSDFYRFDLTQASDVALNLTGLTEPAQLSLIVDLNGNGALDSGEEIAFDAVSDFSISIADRGISSTLGQGTYWARVYTASDTQNTNYTFTASATPTPPTTPADPGNTLAAALNLGTLGTTVQTLSDFVGSLDRNDFYRFDLAQNGRVALNISGLSQAAQISLVADLNGNGVLDSGEEIDFDQVSDFSVSIADRGVSRILQQGTYWARVYTADTNENTNYTITASATDVIPTTPADPGNSLATALNLGVLGAAQTFSDFVGSFDRTDFYRFQLTENGQVAFNISGLDQAAQVSLIADLNGNGVLDAGEEVAFDEVSDFSVSIADRGINRTLHQGTYWVRVYTASDNQNTSYTFTASATDVPPTTPADPGASLATALDLGVLSAPQTFSDVVGSLDRTDLYRFQVNQNSQIVFNIRPVG